MSSFVDLVMRSVLWLTDVASTHRTWKGGREIAKEKRPESGGGPPIVSDSCISGMPS